MDFYQKEKDVCCRTITSSRRAWLCFLSILLAVSSVFFVDWFEVFLRPVASWTKILWPGSINYVLAETRQEAEKNTPQLGRFIRVSLPLTGQGFDRVRNAVRRAIEIARKQHARLTLVFEFHVPAGRKDLGRGSEFGAAHDLANFLSSEELAAVRTVAYIPQSLQGHAVLASLGCQEIVMSPEATIGAASIDERTITPTQRSAYKEMANRRRTVPTVLALAMLDPAVEVLRVDTEVGTEYVTREDLAALKQKHVIKEPVVIKRSGEQAEFKGTEARRLSIAAYLAGSRRELIKALGLSEMSIADDPSLEGPWRPVRIDLRGPIRDEVADRIQRTIEQQIREGDANLICLWIESPGGRANAVMQLANYLAFDIDPARVRTVAYVPKEARSTAAIIATACDQLIMHPDAILGGPGAYELSPEEIAQMVRSIRKELAPRKGRAWSPIAAMIDPQLTVYAAKGPLGDVEYFCDEELQEQSEPERWQRGAPITTPNMPLKLNGRDAEKYHLAVRLVDNFTQFRQYFGSDDEFILAEHGWVDFLIQALASPGVAVLLLIIGGAALYIELHVPGIGIGGFVSAVCFLLFFWSRYLGGTPGWLEVILFLAGVSCILLEIFVIPGFGIFGLGGGALVLVSLVFAGQTFIWPRNEYQFDRLEQSLLIVAAAAVGLIVVAYFLRRWLPRTPLLGHVVLEPPVGEEAERISRRELLVDFSNLFGKRGTTTTPLTPAGKARFGDRLVDVMADGEFISRGATIEVVDVRGNRVLVKETES